MNSFSFIVIIAFVLFSCPQRTENDTLIDTKAVTDTAQSLTVDTLIELEIPKDSIAIYEGKLEGLAQTIDQLYDSIKEQTSRITDSSNYISISTGQGEGGMHALWYFDDESELVCLSYWWAFESQQVELEYLIRNDTIVAVSQFDESDIQRWCINRGGYKRNSDGFNELDANFYDITSESFKDYKIELEEFLNLDIEEEYKDDYRLGKIIIEDSHQYRIDVIISKKLYHILRR